MPKDGFNSISVTDEVYDRLAAMYETNRDKLAKDGINSMAGYVVYLTKDLLKRDEMFTTHTPRFAIMAEESWRLVVEDTWQKRIVELIFKNGAPHCLLCASWDCVHVGFSYSVPSFMEALGEVEKSR